MKNEMTLAFDSISENEGFARVAVAAFVIWKNSTQMTGAVTAFFYFRRQ